MITIRIDTINKIFLNYQNCPSQQIAYNKMSAKKKIMQKYNFSNDGPNFKNINRSTRLFIIFIT
jgi:hypothetical protein